MRAISFIRHFLFLLIIICFCGFQVLGQRNIVAQYSSHRGSTIVFYSDSSYEYHYSLSDLSLQSPLIKKVNIGRYLPHLNKSYYLFSNTKYNCEEPMWIGGVDYPGNDSLAHIIINDSVKSANEREPLFYSLSKYISYYYLIKIYYSRDMIDSVYEMRRDSLMALNYSSDIFLQKENQLKQTMVEELKQLGFINVNDELFQQFVCYGQQLDFLPIPNQCIKNIEITICPTALSNTQKHIKCIYYVQGRNSTNFEIDISALPYQMIHSPYYKQSIIEIVNRAAIVFDSQVFFKLKYSRKKNIYKKNKYLMDYHKYEKFIKSHKIILHEP